MLNPEESTPVSKAPMSKVVLIVAGLLAALVTISIGLVFLVGAVARYQSRADAHNDVIVAQRQVGIAILHARARYQESIGIKKAQDEIRKTLTPLYVGFELTQAMEHIAVSGKNNSIIYVPTDPRTGLPITPTVNTVNPVKP